MIRYLDKNKNLIKEAENIKSVIWHNKYYETGVVQIEAKDYVEGVAYVYNIELQELGIIKNTIVTETSCKYSGYTLEHILSERVISRKVTYRNITREQVVYNLMHEFAGDLVEIPVAPINETHEVIQIFGDNLLTYCQEMLKPIGKSIKIRYDYVTGVMHLVVWKGIDNTDNKEPLSENYDNILKSTVTLNEINYRNYAYVKGEEENQIVVGVDIRTDPNERRLELFVDGSSLTRMTDEGTQLSEQEYRQVLIEKGLNDLYNNIKERDIVVEPPPNDDTEFGELRIYKNNKVNILETQRVTEIILGWENGVLKKNTKLGGI